jgi:hypothetical protein
MSRGKHDGSKACQQPTKSAQPSSQEAILLVLVSTDNGQTWTDGEGRYFLIKDAAVGEKQTAQGNPK